MFSTFCLVTLFGNIQLKRTLLGVASNLVIARKCKKEREIRDRVLCLSCLQMLSKAQSAICLGNLYIPISLPFMVCQFLGLIIDLPGFTPPPIEGELFGEFH